MPANAFITNSESRTLKKRLEELIQHSKELKFLVGYFYFSGWQELYESLKTRDDLTIKLLVGLEVDRNLGQIFEIEKDNRELSGDELAERFFASLHTALNDEALDNQVFYEQVSYFLELLEQGRLQIKKTLEPNHAKLYLFQVKDELRTLFQSNLAEHETIGKFITGSSNLTRAGILAQNEFNVEIGDYGWKEAEAYFDELWQSAVPITEDSQRKDYLLRVVKNNTQVAQVTPFEAYALVLKSYVDLSEQKSIKPHVKRLLEESGFRDYQYQTDAVNQALTIIEEYNGVIIADVVGLGKSVIAGMLAHNLGRRGMVICPPGLMGDSRLKNSGWYRYLEDFKLYGWEVRSSGMLEEAAGYLQEHGEDVEVIIVDEAHRFRNEDTADYERLSNICHNRIVILLTATPFNNTPADIFALLKLFIIPGKSKITLDENLEGRFATYNAEFRKLSYILRYHNDRKNKDRRKRAEAYYDELFEAPLPVNVPRVQTRVAELAAEIRSVIEPVVIRRNRLDLKNDPVYSKEVTGLSTVKDPEELFFVLSPEQMKFYDAVIKEYFSEDGRFHGAIYQPYFYEKRREVEGEKLDEEGNRIYNQQRNLYEFMRRLLVKRFESSFGSFAQSVANFEKIHEHVLEFIKNSGGKYILDRKLLEQIYQSNLDEIDSALDDFLKLLAENPRNPKHDRIYVIEEFERADEFMEHVKDDLALMKEICKKVEKLDLVAKDPKAKRLIGEVGRILKTSPANGEPKRKVIIFSEYLDTVRHLVPVLQEAFDGKVLIGMDLSRNGLNDVLANFDASLKARDQKDDYQILLTSDTLSEGVNLNRAGAIINYDIPWNPTRVIQRVGRINRIGKKVFENLYIYNFFPTEKGADIIKSREIASHKMFLIHNTLGEDAKIFSVDETPNPSDLFKRVNRNPEDEQEQSTLTLVRRLFFDIQAQYPDLVQRIKDLPVRVKTAKAFAQNQLLVFRRKGLGLFIQSIDDTAQEKPEVHSPLFEDSLPRIECKTDEPRLDLSQYFWKSYENIKSHRDVLRIPKSDTSVETKAINNLKSALHSHREDLEELLPFIRTLLEDMLDYKTLPKSTLRRFANINITSPGFKKELQEVRINLGEDYLDIIKKRLGELKSEVIIAIENLKPA